jgi:DNA-binding LytR/AlgR family response regulator
MSLSAISRWENGERLPDITMLSKLANCLETDVSEMLAAASTLDDQLTVILVDDEEIILAGGLHTLTEALPEAQIFGFSDAEEALNFARDERVDVAFLDIELSGESGLVLAEKLTKLNRLTNIIFLTSYSEYMDDAWKRHASGFILKPLSIQRVLDEMADLRHPIKGKTL